jgi:hypothetical protein
MLDFSLQRRERRYCQSVELRALCNEVPRTPPGPEGSNGIGIASGAADHPKFLAPKMQFSVDSGKSKANCEELALMVQRWFWQQRFLFCFVWVALALCISSCG